MRIANVQRPKWTRLPLRARALCGTRATILLCLVAFALGIARGQDISGKLSGHVTDSSGAIIPNASVTASDAATSFSANVVSNSDGLYSFQSLPPGSYTVTCAAPGFATTISRNNAIEARQAFTLSFQMPVATAQIQVEVDASQAQVDTTTAQVQDTLTAEQLRALPVEGRDPRNTVELTQPGTVQAASGNTGTRVRVNGGRGSANNYQIDGTENIDYFNGNASPFPPVEDLSEFSIITNSPQAQYGTSGGSQVSAIVKSGTDHFHGMLWAYIQNSGLNANSWAGNRNGIARPTGSQHWYGGNVGGPLYIPHLYSATHHTFFFVSYEYTSPTAQVLEQQVVPTNAERAGDFSNSTFGIPVVNGVSTPQLNPANFSPMAKALLAQPSLLPTTPNANGTYDWLGSNDQTTQNLLIKVDQQISANHRIFVSFFRYHEDQFENPLFGVEFGSDTLPNEGTSTFRTYLQNWTINDTHTLTANLQNNFILGIRPYTVGPARTNQNANLNWNNLGTPEIVPDGGVPNTEVGIFVNSYFSCCNGFGIWGNYNDTTNLRQYNITDNLTWQHKAHVIRAGYYQRVLHIGKLQDYDAAGLFDFSATNIGSTGNPFADFLLGDGATFMQQSTLSLKLHYPANEAYVQDQWSITPRFTATYGIRWAPNFGIVETQKELSAFRAGEQSTTFPYAPVGLVVPGDPGVPAATYPISWNNFAPRASFAYDITGKGKMVLRAGFGINYDYLYALGLNNIGSAVPYGYTYNPVGPVDVSNVYNGPSPFPYIKPLPGTASTTTYQFPSTPTVYSSTPNFDTGRIYQYNAGYEWEPFKNYLITASFVGTRGTHLASSHDINTPSVSPTATSAAANVQSRRPYPQFQDIYETFSGANSWYRSMQISLNKRFSKNFSILASYTLSRDTDEGDAEGTFFAAGPYRNPYNPNLDYGTSSYDLPQVFSLLYDLQLPSWHSAPWLAREVLNDWAWSGRVQAISGDALTITSPATFNDSASNGAWANYVGGSIDGSRASRNSEAANWLNKAAYCPANEFGIGCSIVDPTAGLTHIDIGNSTRGQARGPGKLFADMNISKKFPISDRFGSLQYDMSAFNVFNHTVLDDPDTSIADGTFGVITGAYPNRVLQMAIHYNF